MKTPEAPSDPTIRRRTLSRTRRSPAHPCHSTFYALGQLPSPPHSALCDLQSAFPKPALYRGFCIVPRNLIFLSRPSTTHHSCSLVSIRGSFHPKSPRRYVAASLSPRMLTFQSQVSAITNSNLFFHSSTRTPARSAVRFGVHPLGCLHLPNQISDQQSKIRPHFAQRTSFGGQHSRGGTGSPNESFFRRNPLI